MIFKEVIKDSIRAITPLLIYATIYVWCAYLTQSIVFGSCLYIALFISKNWIFKTFFGLHSMGTMDYVFLLDSPTSVANMLGKYFTS